MSFFSFFLWYHEECENDIPRDMRGQCPPPAYPPQSDNVGQTIFWHVYKNFLYETERSEKDSKQTHWR